ncbi:hypothetical protein [Escherichia phage EP_H11]|nr:hypothetical protein [Escherichia phage EP_H11]
MRYFDPSKATFRQRKSYQMLSNLFDRVNYRGVFASSTGFPYILVDKGDQTISITVRVPHKNDEQRREIYYKVFHNFATDLPQDPKIFRHSDRVVSYLENLSVAA